MIFSAKKTNYLTVHTKFTTSDYIRGNEKWKWQQFSLILDRKKKWQFIPTGKTERLVPVPQSVHFGTTVHHFPTITVSLNWWFAAQIPYKIWCKICLPYNGKDFELLMHFLFDSWVTSGKILLFSDIHHQARSELSPLGIHHYRLPKELIDIFKLGCPYWSFHRGLPIAHTYCPHCLTYRPHYLPNALLKKKEYTKIS